MAARVGLTGRSRPRIRNYHRWRETMQGLRAEADAVFADRARYGPHLDAVADLRDGIARANAELKGMLAADDAVRPILVDWWRLQDRARTAGRHWYREDGREELLGRMEAIPDLPHRDAALLEDMAAVVAEGRAIAAAEAAAGPVAVRLRNCIEERARLIDETGDRRATCSLRAPLTAWRRDARARLEEARRLLEENGPLARHAHALPELREAIAADRKALQDAVALDERHAACLRDMVEILRRETDEPLFYREGYGAVVGRMRRLAKEPALNGDARALLDRLAAQHDHAMDALAEVGRLVRELGACLDARERLSERAVSHRRSLVDEGESYRSWSEEAERLCRSAAGILSQERYADHLDHVEGARGTIEHDSERLAQALETDAAWIAFAPRLDRSHSSVPELREVVQDAKRMLDRPELDPVARSKLELHVSIRDPARWQDRSHGLSM